MYIIVIAWVYVVGLMALTESSVIAGLATFIFFGVAPLTVMVYLGGAKRRRRRRLLADQRANDDDRGDPEKDQ